MEFTSKKFLTPQQAFEQLKQYCAYQERSHKEVRTKLLEVGLRGNDLEDIIAKLIEQGYLNEERFAVAFAGGKFRMKHWGKNKITQELKRKGVSDYNINKAIKEIPEEDNREALQQLLEKKAAALKDKNIFTRKKKLANFLIGKGYESQLVWKEVGEHFKK